MEINNLVDPLQQANWQIAEIVRAMLNTPVADSLENEIALLTDPSRVLAFAGTSDIFDLCQATDIFSSAAVTCSMYIVDGWKLGHLDFGIDAVFAGENLPGMVSPKSDLICFPGNSWPEMEQLYFRDTYLPAIFPRTAITMAEPGDHALWLRRTEEDNSMLYALNKSTNELKSYEW